MGLSYVCPGAKFTAKEALAMRAARQSYNGCTGSELIMMRPNQDEAYRATLQLMLWTLMISVCF